MSNAIVGKTLPNIPCEEKPTGCIDVIWWFSRNPVIGWNPIPKAARVYNSAIAPFKGEFAGVFRADQKNGQATLFSGTSKDGINIDMNPDHIAWVDEKGNPAPTSYAYDPRVIEIEDEYYITWCDDMNDPSIGLGKTKYFTTFTRMSNPLMPYNRNGVLFPRKINDKYMLLSRPSNTGHPPFSNIFISEGPDLVYRGNHKHVMSKGGQGWWQDTKIGAGPVPIETTEGWLQFYHGVTGTCNGFVYSFGAVILDINEHSKVLYHTRDYLLTPEKSYETTGFVPNILSRVQPCTIQKTNVLPSIMEQLIPTQPSSFARWMN